jgi:hypothetical protein
MGYLEDQIRSIHSGTVCTPVLFLKAWIRIRALSLVCDVPACLILISLLPQYDKLSLYAMIFACKLECPVSSSKRIVPKALRGNLTSSKELITPLHTPQPSVTQFQTAGTKFSCRLIVRVPRYSNIQV